jgi:glycosyltransferase involved in cell wall biosynthesis
MYARACFAIPGDLSTLTGGYGYDRRMLAEAAALGARLDYLRLPGAFPLPTPGDIADSLALLRSVGEDTVLLIDGLAFGTLPADGLATIAQPIVALVHHPLGLEAGLDPATADRLIANERAALARAAAIIVTSGTTGETLTMDFGAPPEKIAVVEPGVDAARRARGSGGPGIALLAVGAIVPRKGFDVLARALSELKDLDWRLRLVGALDRSPEAVAALRAEIDAGGLGDRIALVGQMGPEDLATEYDRADIFVLSSHYEGYGMVLAEAMARGLPIVATTGGAAARTVPDSAGLKAPPGDAGALAEALSRVMSEEPLRRRLAENSWRAGQSLPRWRDGAVAILDVLDKVAKGAK